MLPIAGACIMSFRISSLTVEIVEEEIAKHMVYNILQFLVASTGERFGLLGAIESCPHLLDIGECRTELGTKVRGNTNLEIR